MNENLDRKRLIFSRLKFRRVLKFLGMVLLCLSFFGLGWYGNQRFNPETRLFQKAQFLILKESIFNDQPQPELSYAAVRGMLDAIDDPYAELIEPEAAKDILNAFAGDTGVVGLYAENQSGQVVVLNVFPGGAAQAAGVRAGDVILSIDGVRLDPEADSSETGLLIRGEPGAEVVLEVSRDGQVLTFNLTRQEQEFVVSEMLPENIGYIALGAFNKNASQKMKAALEEMLDQDPTGLVWDLRGNEGGDMQAAQEILSFFIEDGLLFTAELTQGRTASFHAKGEAIAGELPLVVLMDSSTYSAGETSAIAIADSGRGTTVGSRSYGKGLIQATIPLVDEALLQMTIAKWLSAEGNWYQETGVPAQVEALDDPATDVDEVLEAGLEILKAGE